MLIDFLGGSIGLTDDIEASLCKFMFALVLFGLAPECLNGHIPIEYLLHFNPNLH